MQRVQELFDQNGLFKSCSNDSQTLPKLNDANFDSFDSREEKIYSYLNDNSEKDVLLNF